MLQVFFYLKRWVKSFFISKALFETVYNPGYETEIQVIKARWSSPALVIGY